MRTLPGTTRLAPSFLLEVAAGFAASPLWPSLAAPTRHARSAVRVARTACYEVWVLGWWPGQRVELHDHGASHAAFAVVSGDLVEVTARADAGLDRAVLPAGSSRAVPAGTRHDVLNLGAEPAVSIHVYSPVLTEMTFYDATGQRALRTEQVDSDDAVWPEPAADRRSETVEAARA